MEKVKKIIEKVCLRFKNIFFNVDKRYHFIFFFFLDVLLCL